MSKPSHKIRLIPNTRSLAKLSQSRSFLRVPNTSSQPKLQQESKPDKKISFTDSFKKSPLRSRPQNSSLNRTLNPVPASLQSKQKSTSKRQSRIRRQGVNSSYDSELSNEFQKLQKAQHRKILEGKYRLAQTFFSKLIHSDPIFAPALQQVKSIYQEYTSHLQNRHLQSSQIQTKIQKLQNREKQFVNLIMALKKKGYPVNQASREKIPKVPCLAVPPVSSFQDQFMAHLPQFSESWRKLIEKEHRLQQK